MKIKSLQKQFQPPLVARGGVTDEGSDGGDKCKSQSIISILSIPQSLRDSVSLRLGHATALNVHRTFIHSRGDASLPLHKGAERFLQN